MAFKAWRALIVLVVALATMASCTSSASPETPPSTAERPVDYRALNAAIENKITSGSVALDNVRAVLISVDGETRIVHYRHRFTAEDTTHVWSVTKTVVSTLIGIAIIRWPHRQSRSNPDGVASSAPGGNVRWSGEGHPSAVDDHDRRIWRRPAVRDSQEDLQIPGRPRQLSAGEGPVADAGTVFAYSNTSSHLVAAVLATALQRADGDHPRSVLDYARERLFDPLQIDTRPAYSKPLLDTAAAEFVDAGFGWGTDPKGIAVGAFGLRLRTPDLLKLGELYLNDGTWHGKQILPAHWVKQATSPSELNPQYGLMWWLYTWNGHEIYAARGSEGHLIVVVPDQKSATAISSGNLQEYPMTEEALFPLMSDVIIPGLDGS